MEETTNESVKEVKSMLRNASTPAPNSGVKLADFTGCLVIITPTSVGVEKTSLGEREVTRVDLDVLDGEQQGSYANVFVFGKVLRQQLTVGEQVVGRLGHGTASAGRSAPWVLLPATAAELKVAEDFLVTGWPSPF